MITFSHTYCQAHFKSSANDPILFSLLWCSSCIALNKRSPKCNRAKKKIPKVLKERGATTWTPSGCQSPLRGLNHPAEQIYWRRPQKGSLDSVAMVIWKYAHLINKSQFLTRAAEMPGVFLEVLKGMRFWWEIHHVSSPFKINYCSLAVFCSGCACINRKEVL